MCVLCKEFRLNIMTAKEKARAFKELWYTETLNDAHTEAFEKFLIESGQYEDFFEELNK